MTSRKTITFIFAVFLFLSCQKEEETINASSIKIGSYIFDFDTEFTLQESQGIDSYVGSINGAGLSLSFDYGMYTRPLTNLPTNEYSVIEEVINGHYKQIVKPVDPQNNFTSLHVFKISDSIANPLSYDSLSVFTHKINSEQQDMIVKVFTNLRIVE